MVHPQIESLRSKRRALGLTQEQLAEEVGMSKAYLAQLETGIRSKPSWDIIERISSALTRASRRKNIERGRAVRRGVAK